MTVTADGTGTGAAADQTATEPACADDLECSRREDRTVTEAEASRDDARPTSSRTVSSGTRRCVEDRQRGHRERAAPAGQHPPVTAPQLRDRWSLASPQECSGGPPAGTRPRDRTTRPVRHRPRAAAPCVGRGATSQVAAAATLDKRRHGDVASVGSSEPTDRDPAPRRWTLRRRPRPGARAVAAARE